MKVDFIRFKATDDVELQGWLSNTDGDLALLCIHGMGGNGYENYFLDGLRETAIKNNVTFFAIDTRGRGIVSDFRQSDSSKHAGSCFEIFEESFYDIEGAIDYLKSIGKNKFILQGHSLGCTKVVNYVLSKQALDVKKVILLAPTDMVGWASTDADHENNLAKAKKLLAESKGEELVGAQCWPLDKTPLSAQAYQSKSEAGTPVDIYGERNGALLGRVEQQMLIIYGDRDIGITEIDGSIEKYIERVSKIKHANTQIGVIEGAAHSFRGHENWLTEIVEEFVIGNKE